MTPSPSASGRLSMRLRQAADSEGGADLAEWAAPAMIDALSGSRANAWLSTPGGLRALASEDGFLDHVAELSSTAEKRDFGTVSDGLCDLLVDIALGSPAVCALRALHRIAPQLAWDDPGLLSAAAEVAWAFRTLFNQHDAVALLRRGAEDRYWHRVLTYSVDNNLQAVLDEYAHYLVDAEGLSCLHGGRTGRGCRPRDGDSFVHPAIADRRRRSAGERR